MPWCFPESPVWIPTGERAACEAVIADPILPL